RKVTTHPTLPPNRRKIYLALLTVPRGRWTTYAALAKHLKTSPRAIGAAMRLNPFAPDVPCHRVLGGGGKLLVGYSGDGRGGPGTGRAKEGVGMKRRLLEEEGVRFSKEGVAGGVCFEGFG
ncbi:DNA binding methylated-DNA--cysteine S-methyltransferase, partial [Aspergillus ellipticus CBS 707.79]